MSNIYVPQVPSRWDKKAGIWVPTVDLSPANRFGNVIELLPPEASRLQIAPLVTVLKEKLRNYTTDDMIVALGDPSIIAITASIAVAATGLLRLLKWDRQTSDYILVEARIR